MSVRSTWRWSGGFVLLLTACGRGGSGRSLTEPPVEKHLPPWLEVSWISREPRLAPPDSVADPRAGWPAPGSQVRWVAHLINRGEAPAGGVPYRWLLDGIPMDSGSTDMPVGRSTVEWARPWTSDRHRITFELTPAEGTDARADDDTLTVFTDALSVGFWVHRSIYGWMTTGALPGFERQAQRWLEAWNVLFVRSAWPSSPDGVLDRLRLDRVEVLPDEADYPKDVDTDLAWFFSNRLADRRFLHVGSPDDVREDQTIVLHELLHERGLTDLYAYEVKHDSPNGSYVGIEEDGRLVAGTVAMPLLPDNVSVFKPSLDGLMGGEYQIATTRISEHSAAGLNLRAGLRTPRWTDGWGNAIDGFAKGPYVNLLPDTTLVLLRAPDGSPLPRARVDVFLDHGQEFYTDVYDAEPDRTFDADDGGVLRMPGDILDGTYTVESFPKPWTLILRVQHLGGRVYLFLPGYELNLVYFRGGHHEGRLDLTVQLP